MHSSESVARTVGQVRERAEQAVARVKDDRALDDRQKGQQISGIWAAANARFIELHAEYRRAAAAESGYQDCPSPDTAPFHPTASAGAGWAG